MPLKRRKEFFSFSKEAEKLAKQHWVFQEKWLSLVFQDGFIHGFKHGVEYETKRRRIKWIQEKRK